MFNRFILNGHIIMETNQIIENNKLIANFIGLNLLKDTKHWHKDIEGLSNEDRQLYCINENKSNWYSKLLIDLEYPSSWDWLMPVLEKCYQTNKNDDWDMWLNDALLTVNIDVLYNAVIEFIKWYNLNKES